MSQQQELLRIALECLKTVARPPVPVSSQGASAPWSEDARAIVVAGSKSLTSDLLVLEGYGVGHTLKDARTYAANEDHGYLDVSHPSHKPSVGSCIRTAPNDVCAEVRQLG